MNSPKLRFKNFHDEWKTYRLKDFSSRVTRKNKNNISHLPLTISAQDGLVDQTSFFNKTVASKDLSGYYLLFKGDFAYNKSYSNGYPWGAIKRLDKYDMGVLSTLYICFKPDNTINSNFLAQLFNSAVWYNGVSEIAVEGARNHGLLNISVGDFFETTYKIPILEEQEKISNFLSLIDKKIELQQKLVDSLQLYKKGLLQKVFSNNSGWKTVKLKNYFDITSSKRVFQSEWTTKGVPFYRAREIVKLVNNGYVDNELFISKSMYDEYSKKYGKIKKNDLLITGVGTIGICYLVKETDEFYFKDGNLIWLKPKSNNINSNFVKYLFKSNYIINQINDFGNGTTVATYTIDNANETKIIIPNIEEQNRIAELFSSIDDKISYETKKLENLKTYKKGLLQQMFI